MKQFVLLMAIVGLAATGCAQNRVFGTHARRGGADLKIARSQAKPKLNLQNAFAKADQQQRLEEESDIQLTMYGVRCRNCNKCDDSCCDDTCCGGCDDTCCGECDAECGCPEDCCADGCCDGGCCDSGCCTAGCCTAGCCADGCCDGGCCDSGCCDWGDGCCSSGSCSAGGCSSCGAGGCGPCQRMAGRIASGWCPHACGYPEAYNYNPSPPVGQVAYPYYTVRGPRDFLRNNPPSIGPY